MSQKSNPQEKYLRLARRSFAEKGFSGTSLAGVAKQADVSKQALLHFFKTKERLYAAVLSDLSTELLAEIDAVQANTPAQRLVTYFDQFADAKDGREEAAKLVVRVLMGTEACLGSWPLKPYLDRLIELAQQTERWKDVPKAVVLAQIYRLVGTLQFFQISRKTLTAMYDIRMVEEMEEALLRDVRTSIRSFASFG